MFYARQIMYVMGVFLNHMDVNNMCGVVNLVDAFIGLFCIRHIVILIELVESEKKKKKYFSGDMSDIHIPNSNDHQWLDMKITTDLFFAGDGSGGFIIVIL